jgi:hypothetical protein
MSKFAYGNTRPKFQPFATFDPPQSFVGEKTSEQVMTREQIKRICAKGAKLAANPHSRIPIPNRLFGVEINHEGDAI